LTSYQQQQAARQLAQRLLAHPWFVCSHNIAFYQAADGEISPHYLLEQALALGKNCYLPVLRRFPKQQLGFVRIHRHSRLHRHRFGMLEPQQRLRRFVHELDMVCMPLVGFDRFGRRLGMGGGFYDRSLGGYRNRKVLKTGLAHDCQQVDRLENAVWDIPLNAIFTPTQTLIINTSGKAQLQPV
jgi:5-formyltetrahydrofolate cyclo-ligase